MESLATNFGVGTSVVHGMSVLVRVQTPEPIQSSIVLIHPGVQRPNMEQCYFELEELRRVW